MKYSIDNFANDETSYGDHENRPVSLNYIKLSKKYID